MIGLVERQIQILHSTEKVWRGRIIKRIRTTLKARIKKERGKGVQRTEGYSNDEHAMRREFGIDAEVDGPEAAGGLRDAGRGHGRQGRQWDQGPNVGVLDDVALLREQADVPSQVEQTDLEETNAPISII